MKPKEYLVKQGLMQEIKRGRLALEHIQVIKEAVTNGAEIEGYACNETDDAVVKSDPNEKIVYELLPDHFPERDFVAVQRNADGKKIIRSMREACRHCRMSLIGCYCSDPQIVALDGRGSVSVKIERK